MILKFLKDSGDYKEGKCTSNSDSEIELDNKIILQKNRVVRIEVKRGISNE
jgi:hypothetical protein